VTLALRATGLLGDLNRVGVLSAADVHVAQRFGALSGEIDERALLALALAVRSVRAGSVVLDLASVSSTVRSEDGDPVELPDLADWRAVLDASPLVGGPLHREGDLLWLHAYWRQEVFVADELLRRAVLPVDVDASKLRDALARLWPGAAPDDQRLAAAVCALAAVSVVGGGPGTGKTTTVARLLVALREASPAGLRVALAAPTGKAAARLRESMVRPDDVLTDDERSALAALPSSTLHRLLGVRRGSDRFWHDANNRLPYDVVVVDEASMVSLSMFAKLLEALRPDARLVLVGDPNQLVSVEAGAVLADLVGDEPPVRTSVRAAALAAVVPSDAAHGAAPESPGTALRDGIALLTQSRRFEGDGPIDLLARAIRAGEGEEVLARLREGSVIEFVEVDDDQVVPGELLKPVMVAVARDVVAAASVGDAAGALAALDRHRLLCAHRDGPRGVRHWEQQVRTWLQRDGVIAPRRDGRYAGQPLLVTSNDYDNKLWNGDTGVVVQEGENLLSYFSTGGPPTRVPLGRLGDVRPMYVMTVHRAQGSQFDSVTVLLPPASSPLGTRETLYTAVSRAENKVRVLGSKAAVLTAVGHRAQRASGLRARLARPEGHPPALT